MRIVDYLVVVGVTPTDLKTQVRSRIDSGWKLQGGVSVTRGLTGLFFAQAVVFFEEWAKD